MHFTGLHFNIVFLADIASVASLFYSHYDILP